MDPDAAPASASRRVTAKRVLSGSGLLSLGSHHPRGGVRWGSRRRRPKHREHEPADGDRNREGDDHRPVIVEHTSHGWLRAHGACSDTPARFREWRSVARHMVSRPHPNGGGRLAACVSASASHRCFAAPRQRRAPPPCSPAAVLFKTCRTMWSLCGVAGVGPRWALPGGAGAACAPGDSVTGTEPLAAAYVRG